MGTSKSGPAKHGRGNEVSDDRRTGCPYQQQQPTEIPPKLVKSRRLNENVGEIRGAVENIGHYGEQKQRQAEIDRENLFGGRVSGHKMQNHHAGQNQVVTNPPTLPEADRVAGFFAKINRVHGWKVFSRLCIGRHAHNLQEYFRVARAIGNPTQNMWVSRLRISPVKVKGALLLGRAERGTTIQVITM